MLEAAVDQLSSDLASLRIERSARPPPVKWVRWLIALLAVLGVAGVIRYVGLPYAEAKLFKIEVGVTEVAIVSPAQASIDLSSTGYVVPQVIVDVSSKTMGRVDKVSVREGQKVKAGDVLFT